jgi:energy-coupling factor transporter ATP-binding protein EcfA2
MSTATVGEHTLADIDLTSLVAAIPTYTFTGTASIMKRLAEPLTDVVGLEKRQNQLRAIKGRCKESDEQVSSLRAILRDNEADVMSMADAATDTRLAEYYNQILWDPKSSFSRFNHMGWITEIIVFFRTLFLPGMSLLMPIFIFIAPLVILHMVLKEPVTPSSYLKLLQSSIKKVVPSVLGTPKFAGSGGILETGEQFMHIAVSLGVFVASIWSQVSSAISMRSTVADMRRRAAAVRTFSAATEKLGSLLGEPVVITPWSEGDMGLFGDAWNSPDRVRTLLAQAGELDMLAAVALQKRVCFVSYDSSGSTLAIKDLYHPGTGEKRVYNSVSLDAKNRRHVLLTGPNRGGKSTVLKSLGAAVLMSQTLGVVFGKKATMPVFEHIITALSPSDVIGKLSLFEAEIEFAKGVKATIAAAEGPVFLMMDEIFHGTNAHDGVEASQVFLDELYADKAKEPVFSVVSTHYMDLPARYGETKTQNLCMEASVDPADEDRLVYTYLLKAGVNKFSSVREILRERGLMSPKVAKPAEEVKEAVKEEVKEEAECVLPTEKTPESGSKA